MSTPVRQEIVYDVSANSAKFVAESAKQKTAAEQVREAIAKGTRELTKQEVAALGAAEATKKINKAAVDAAASAERMRRQFEMARVPAAGLVQSVGMLGAGLLSVVGKVGMVISGFKELKKLSNDIDNAIANWDVPDWLISTPGSKIQNAHNRARMNVNASISASDAALTLGAATRDRNAAWATINRNARGVTAGSQGFRSGPGFAGVIAGNTMDQNWIGSDFGRGSGGRGRSTNWADVAGQSIGWGDQIFPGGGGAAAQGMLSGAAGGVTGFGDSNASMLGQGFAGGAGGGTTQNLAALDEFTEKIKDQTSIVGGAFSTMSAGLAAGVEAAISGSQSIGQAIKQALAAQLKSIAVESSVRALFETAQGFAALANPVTAPKAAIHFKSAAVFAATAVAAGVGSAAIGSLGSSASAGTGGASQTAGLARGNASSSSSSSGNAGPTYVIYVNGTIGDGHVVAQQVESGLRRAQQAGRIRSAESRVMRTE